MRKPAVDLFIPVDLAAVCSVAIVILMLYLSMARPKITEPVEIDMPETSGIRCSIDGLGDAMVLIGEGKLFLSIPDTIRESALRHAGLSQKITFADAELDHFKQTQFIGMPADGFNSHKQGSNSAGISSNQLARWLQIAAEEYERIYKRPMRISIKADKATPYAEVKKVITVLQDQHINKFMFITATKKSNDD